MHHLIVTDLDGTLLNDRHGLDDVTIETFRELESRGHTIALATGRHHIDVRGIRKVLGIDAFIVSANGASIHDTRDQSIYRKSIPAELARELLQLTLPYDVMTQIFTPTEWLVDRPNEAMLWSNQQSGFQYRLEDLSRFDGENIEKILLFGQPEILAQIEAAIHEKYPERVAALTYTDAQCLEIMAPGVSKGVALQMLMGQLGIEAPQVLAFGDNLNDVEMLSVAGRPHVMANAHPRLFELFPDAAHIGHNDDGAVAHALKVLLE